MLSGSLASSLQGEPRSTHDIDLVVDLKLEQLSNVIPAFPPPDFYLSAEAAREAIERRSMFNLLDNTGGDKVDFWLLTREPFDQSRFSRRVKMTLDGRELWVSAPEDTILMKLQWSKLSGGSQKQFKDALRVYELYGTTLDLNYLNHWAQQLQVMADWQRLLADAQPLNSPPNS